MTKTNGNNLLLILGVALAVAVVSSVVTASITGFALFPTVKNPPIVRATSCDADSVCEVHRTISTTPRSSSSLILTSANKYINMIDKVGIAKFLDTPKIIFHNPDENGEFGDSEKDDPFISIEKMLTPYGFVHNLKEGDYRTISYPNLGRQGKTVKLDAVGTKNVVVSVDGESKIMAIGDSGIVNGVGITVKSITPNANKGESSAILVLNGNPEFRKELVFSNSNDYIWTRIMGELNTQNIVVNNLKRDSKDITDNAFVCVDKGGHLYRSSTACA